MRVKGNLPGRAIFLGFTLVCLVFIALQIIAAFTLRNEHTRWMPAVASLAPVLAFILLLVICFVKRVYKLRLLNLTLLAILTLATVWVLVLMVIEEVAIPVIVLTAVQFIYLTLMAIIMVPRSTSDWAYRMHPFVAIPDMDEVHDRRQGFQGQGKRVKHREINIFEDWPVPVPFPARALYSFQTSSTSELPFARGDQLVVLDCRGNWWQARNPRSGLVGFVPSNYIQVLQKALVLEDYDGSNEDEIAIREGETIEVMEIHEQMCLVRGVDGRIGSVPTTLLRIEPITVSEPADPPPQGSTSLG